jgi:hypothetical protein
MRNWPAWFPCPNAWMSALVLTIFAGSILAWSEKIAELGNHLTRYSYRVSAGCGILAIVFPIIIVAVMHHIFHVFLDNCIPDSQTPQTERTTGVSPSLISWWEGLYSWLVLVLATILSVGIVAVFLPESELYRLIYLWNRVWYKLDYLITFPTLIWLVVAAYLYQFEHLVRQRLMSVQHNR